MHGSEGNSPHEGIPKRPVKGEKASLPVTKLKELPISQKVKLAMKGNKEIRSLLIQDPSRTVQLSVINNPGITPAEVERYASMRTVDAQVLRNISANRQFIRNYGVKKALVNNPRTPLRTALSLVPHLMKKDLKAVSDNRNLPAALRVLARNQLREKLR